MSRAEDIYLEYFQDGKVRNCSNKDAFLLGYHQAEKDLALTWEDLALMRLAFDATEDNINHGCLKISKMTKEYYQEVLKRFKNFKERKEL